MISKYTHKFVSNLFSDYPINKIEFKQYYKFRISIINKKRKRDNYWSVTTKENEDILLKIPPFIDYSIKIENIYIDPKICYTLESLKINGRSIKSINKCVLFCFDQYLIEGYSEKCPFISIHNTILEFTLKEWNVVENNGETILGHVTNTSKIKINLDTSNG